MWKALVAGAGALALIAVVIQIAATYNPPAPAANLEASRAYEGKLIRRASGQGRDAGWYYVEKGYRRYVADADWVLERGMDPATIATLPTEQFDAITENPEPLRSVKAIAATYEGKVVRRSAPGSGKQAGWYLVSQGKRQWIVDGRWLTEHGISPQDVVTIPDAEFDAMPENPQSLAPSAARSP